MSGNTGIILSPTLGNTQETFSIDSSANRLRVGEEPSAHKEVRLKEARSKTEIPSSRTRCGQLVDELMAARLEKLFMLVVGPFILICLVVGLHKSSLEDGNVDKGKVLSPPELPPVEPLCQSDNIFCSRLAQKLLFTRLSSRTNLTCDCNHTSTLLVPIRTERPNEAWSSSIPSTNNEKDEDFSTSNNESDVAIPSSSNETVKDGFLLFTQGRIANTSAQELLRPPIRLEPGLVRSRPIPTNAWWGNLIHREDAAENPSHPIFSQPYRLQFKTEDADFSPDSDQSAAGLHVSHPHQYRVWGPINENDASAYFYHWPTTDLVLSAKDLTPSTVAMLVTDWDISGFGVTAGIYHKGNKNSYFEAFLTQGMAMVTAEYHAWTPSVLLPERTILSITAGTNDDATKPDGTVTADKLILELDNDQHWVIYTSEAIRWSVSETGLVAQDVFDGVLSVAKLPNPQATIVYDAHRDCIVKGGELLAPDSSHYAIQWHTRGVDCAKNGILHFSLPHHESCLTGDAVPFEGLVLPSTTRGNMQAYVSRSGLWRFEEVPDHDIDFLPPNPLSPEMRDQTNLAVILEKEITEFWDIRADGSYYFNGKAIQKYATLCLLAGQTSIVGTSGNGNLSEICLSKLKSEFDIFVDNAWAYPLVYDEVYRGIVSSEGFLKSSVLTDFGNTVYNDHHYHWGYWIVASSILRHLSPDWDRMDELSAVVELLIRDVANPSSDDHWFPMFRQFDWYLGHSLSRGVTPSVDGKDQESVSEEMNLHYGLLLWGKVSRNPSLQKLGQLMLKVDARAIRSYFLFTSDNQVQPKSLLPNKVSGIISDNKITYSTWFCSLRECIHGIQMLPVSPVSPIYRSNKFIQEEWTDVLSLLPVFEDNPSSSWLSLMYVNLAHVDQATALQQLPYVSLDGGLSRSWATYYAAVQVGL